MDAVWIQPDTGRITRIQVMGLIGYRSVWLQGIQGYRLDTAPSMWVDTGGIHGYSQGSEKIHNKASPVSV